jgi:MFS family permease
VSVAADRVHRPLVLGCIMLTVFMASIEITIVAMAMPQIVSAVGGFELYGWVFAALLLAQATTTVIYGKLADLYGRKPVLIGGIVIFLIGSLFCGFAATMPALILFRFIQGLGAGSMQSVSMTIFGDLYTPRERTRIQGQLAAVWALSALIGPLAGAFIVEQLSWPWVFWINIPIGIAAIAGLSAYLHENVQKRSVPIDYAGALFVCAAVSSLLLLLTLVADPGADVTFLVLLAAGFLISVLLLLRQERRAKDPIIAFDLWLHPVIAPANAASLAAGLTFIGITTFLPVYVQVVMSRSAVTAGITLTMMAIGWPVAATLARRFYNVMGMQSTARAGGIFLGAGSALFLVLGPRSHPMLPALASMVCGFGLGFLMATCVLLVQGSVDWKRRGSATASNVFARTLGNTLGAALLGTVLNIVLTHSANVSPDEVRRILGQEGGTTLPVDAALHAALDYGLHVTFWGIFAFGLLTASLAFLLPDKTLDELSGGISQGAGRA